MTRERLAPTVTINLRPVAYKDLPPAQRAAWDRFWRELIQRVHSESCRPKPGRAKGSTENQRRSNDASEDNLLDDISMPHQ